MNILVIGSGGREHALIKSFQKSASVKQIFVLPGNDGMAEDAKLIPISQNDFEKIVFFCQSNHVDFVFIGPEEPLVNGLSDALRENKILCVGPSKKAAQLEGSKIFAKNFMNSARIPTANAFVVSNVENTLEQAQSLTPPYILKADGLAAGKGVFICQSLAELKNAATDLFVRKKFGSAGEKALLEENLPGKELSFLILTNGKNYEVLPLAQDHKRLSDHDLGPNTGGMGTIAPMKIPPELYQKIMSEIIQPSVLQIEKENLLFRGILFVGIMVVGDQPYALEYNTRFGDPETQVILPLIENDTAALFLNLAKGILEPIQQNNLHSICIVNAAEGYPENPLKGEKIMFNDKIKDHILFCGVQKNAAGYITNGGRVLNVVATSVSKSKAIETAYSMNDTIEIKNRLYRTDIGRKEF